MWVEIAEILGDVWVGKLDNQPDDMPQLNPGDEIRFGRKHIVDFKMYKPERLTAEQLSKLPAPKREYWDRCLVDDCVLYENKLVGYLCREEPEKNEGESEFKDSGWRIRGDSRGATLSDCDNRKTSFVALGAVLNRDDSWLHLLDEDPGSAFLRDFARNTYSKVMSGKDVSTSE
jgi:hypothetical protein